MKKEISIGAIVFKKDLDNNKFLILKRRDNNIWEFPKGHVEKGETEVDTLKRELYEELGTDEYSLINNFKENIEYVSSRNIIRIFIFYLIKLTGRIKKSKEHVDFKWINVNEASKYFKYDDMVSLLKRADRIIDE
ncbi:MAG TPA: NUDIX domain-containing protein [Candidatus Nanoarchaeia archaeon]|nr:NUDIX domain-containing protein [Candidatus Nanoarchaeia archaeon]